MPVAQSPITNQDFQIKNFLPVLSTAYGEAASEDYETKLNVLSSIINRINSGRPDFGADSGNISDVLQKGYYAYSNQSPKFMEGMEQKFPDKASEDSFKEIVAIWSGLMKGKIQPTDTEFFLTPSELRRIKRTKSMNLDLLEEVGKGKKFVYLRYKPVPKKGRKPKSATKR